MLSASLLHLGHRWITDRIQVQLGMRRLVWTGRHFDLAQFGVSHETSAPGARSTVRRWHTGADEFVRLPERELVVRTDQGELTRMAGGDADLGNARAPS